MKKQMIIYDKLIILVVVITIISLIGTWSYYAWQSRRIEHELLLLNEKSKN